MRQIPNMRVEQYRYNQHPLTSTIDDGNNGAFMIPSPLGGELQCIVSDGTELKVGWEHVSIVHVGSDGRTSTPKWEEMAYVKNLFWHDEETVMQLHPPKSLYVNNHPHCLHLWKPRDAKIPLPPTILVGIKT